MPTKKQLDRSRAQFLTWVKIKHPAVYQAAVSRANAATLGQTDEAAKTSWWQKAVTGIAAVGTTYLGLKNQRDAMKINLQRAEAGLEPIDIEGSAPVIKTQIELSDDILSKITESAGSNINKMLLFGGAAVIALLLVMQPKRR